MRFPGFVGEWEKRKLGDACIINPKSKNLPSSFVYIDLESVSNGHLSNETTVSRDEAPSRAQRILERGDVLFQMVRPYQKNNLYFDKEGEYVASTGYAQIRTNRNPQFIFQYLHNQKFVDQVIERCTGTSYPAINSSDLGTVPIYQPEIKEQQKIAEFLMLIDRRIETQNKIIENLKSLIKVVTEKSIAGFDSNSEIKTLAELGQIFSGLSGKSKEDFGNGKPYVQYKQIFDSGRIDFDKCGLVKISSNETQTKLRYGDVCFTISSETPGEIGMSSVLLDDPEEIYLNSFCFGYRINSFKILDPIFARYFFRSGVFRDKIVKLAQGSTRYNMSKTEFLKLKIKLPSFNEQIRIANLLSSIDSKIDVDKRFLQKLEEQKEYLLQNLFA